MPGIKQTSHRSASGSGRMALASSRGKRVAVPNVSVAALFDFAVERQLVREKAGWFAFGESRLGQSRTQAVEFLKKNRLVASSLQKSVLNSVLKAQQPGGVTPQRRNKPSRSAAPRAHRESSPNGPTESTSADAINRLYDELASLTAQQVIRPRDATLRGEVRSKLSHLRRLQEAEAALIEQRFLGSLSVPLGTLQNLLKSTLPLSGPDEDPSAADEAPDIAD